jgi:hypothetical protein
MFIHFNSDTAECDNCGTPSTIMHMSIEQFERSVHLCIVASGRWRMPSVTLEEAQNIWCPINVSGVDEFERGSLPIGRAE